MQRPQQEKVNSVVHETKVLKQIRDYEYSSDFPEEPDIGTVRVSDRFKDQDGHDRLFYGAGIAATGAQHTRRNQFDVKQPYAVGPVSVSKQASNCLNSLNSGDTERKKLEAIGCWKNSVEEEFIWDDIKTKTTDLGGPDSSRKGVRTCDETKSMSLQRSKWISSETEHVDSNLNKANALAQYNTTKEDVLPPYMVFIVLITLWSIFANSY